MTPSGIEPSTFCLYCGAFIFKDLVDKWFAVLNSICCNYFIIEVVHGGGGGSSRFLQLQCLNQLNDCPYRYIVTLCIYISNIFHQCYILMYCHRLVKQVLLMPQYRWSLLNNLSNEIHDVVGSSFTPHLLF